jgi:hypothetical protein
VKNAGYRLVAQSILKKECGYDVSLNPGQGYLPGARLIAARSGQSIDVAVKASQERILSFTRRPNKRWRTLHSVDLVIAIVPSEQNPDEADVYAFERKPLIRAFDRAWKALEDAKRSMGFNIPIFVPIDEVSRKNVGHAIGNLKKHAVRTFHLTEQDLEELSSGIEESYVDAFRRRFAAENGVDVSQVMVSIVGKPK